MAPGRPTGIHEAPARGFARSPDAYDRARPEYPPEAVARLARRLALRPGRRVVDLAAGTGKLTRTLMRTGAEVVPLGPLTEMCARIGPGPEVLAGAAEGVPLPDADAVTVGQAFHWFDGTAALAEIHRGARSGGGLALVWNRPPADGAVHAAVERTLDRRRGRAPVPESRSRRDAFDATTLFGALDERTFHHARLADAGALADRLGSRNVVPSLDDRSRAEVLGAVRGLAADAPLRLAYGCEVFVCDRRP
jgi:SAM-dependent methyltransferase